MKNRIKILLAKRNSGRREITTEQGIKAILKCAEIAEQYDINWAIAGGIAVQIYGFTRATVDADVIAEDVLPFQNIGQISFGGEKYQIRVGRENITVDWIVRDDDKQEVYEAALEDAEEFERGIKIITPEWLVILKQLAGRGKDELDLLWLLRQKDLVDRKLVEKHIRQLFGKNAYWALQDLESLYLEADLMKARDERFE
jgi:hypothetical protein